MNEYKINTDIISTTGITIDSRNIPMSTGKVVINNVEVTDIDSWNKAISTFSELENKINNLQSKIDKTIEFIKESNTYYEITHYIPEDEKQFKINMETLTNHLLDIIGLGDDK